MTADDWRDLLEWLIWALIIGGIVSATLWFGLVTH
jgi:hypothetical protein